MECVGCLGYIRHCIFAFSIWTVVISTFHYDWIILKRIHEVTWIGTLLYVASQVTVTMVWGSPAWHNFWSEVTHFGDLRAGLELYRAFPPKVSSMHRSLVAI
jgi:hypothetical protein